MNSHVTVCSSRRQVACSPLEFLTPGWLWESSALDQLGFVGTGNWGGSLPEIFHEILPHCYQEYTWECHGSVCKSSIL